MTILVTIFTFLLKYIKYVIPGVLIIWGFTYVSGLIDESSKRKEDAVVFECNEKQLNDQVNVLEQELEKERLDKERLTTALNEINWEAKRRQEIINDLEDILSDKSLEDGKISPRTKEFYRQLNEKSKELQDE